MHGAVSVKGGEDPVGGCPDDESPTVRSRCWGPDLLEAHTRG